MKKIAILQSNYIPWKGYFDLINMVDEFILYDDVQYTKGDWRNRNKIKTPQGLQWLTIPVLLKGKGFRPINSIKVADQKWRSKHWESIKRNYSRAENFELYAELFKNAYLEDHQDYLSDINYKFILLICEILGISTKIRKSSEFDLVEGQTERLLGICKDCNADVYLSGPAAQCYFDTELAHSEGIKVEWMDYSGYDEYKQLFGSFEHGVSVLDLIFNEGERASQFMKSFKANK